MAKRQVVLGMLVASLIVALALASTGGVAAQPGVRGVAPAADPFYEVRQIPVTADTMINSRFGSRNYNNDWTVLVRGGDGASPMYQADISSLGSSPNLVVGKALLRLYVIAAKNQTPLDVSAYAVLKPWAPTQVNWYMADIENPWERSGANGDSDREQDGTDPTTFAGEGHWVEIDVTPIVSRWYDGRLPNHGLILKAFGGTTTEYTIVTTEHSTKQWRPYLEVSLTTLPTPTATATATATATPLPAVLVEKVGPAGPLYVREYEMVSYTINVQNNGPMTLTHVIITDTLPLGTEFIDASHNGTYDDSIEQSGAVIWDIAELGGWETQAVSLRLGIPTWVKEKGNIVNLARANCAECMEVREDYWETSVQVPTSTPTATTQATATPTATAQPAEGYYLVLVTNGWRMGVEAGMQLPLVFQTSTHP